MRLFRSDDIHGCSLAGEQDLLIREADEAFHADDRDSCVETIDRLYDLLDASLISPRRGQRPEKKSSSRRLA